MKQKKTKPITHLLQDYNGEKIKGSFYDHEMVKVKYPDVFLIEKVIRRKGNKLLVKWLGFDDSENSWIDKNDL